MRRKQHRSNSRLPLITIAGALVLALAGGCTSYAEPEWTSVAKLEGTSYVTDGNIAIDTKVIQMAQPPPLQSASKWFSDSIFQNARADSKEQFSIDDIRESAGNPGIVVGPDEQQLEEKYVSYLSGKLSSSHRVAFWQLGVMEPMVIVVDGQAVGAMKALN